MVFIAASLILTCRLWVAVILALCCTAAAAQTHIAIEIGSIEGDGISLSELSGHLILEDHGPGALRIESRELSTPEESLARNLRLTCKGLSFASIGLSCAHIELDAKRTDTDLRIGGPLQFNWAPLAFTTRGIVLQLPGGDINVSGSWGNGPGNLILNSDKLEFEKIWPVLAPRKWRGQYSDPAGHLVLGGVVSGTGKDNFDLAIGVQTHQLSLLGINVVENLDGRMSLDAHERGQGMNWEFLLEADGGLAYVEPGLTLGEDYRPGFAFEFETQPVRLLLDGLWLTDTRMLSVDSHLLQRGVIDANIRFSSELTEQARIHSLEVAFADEDASGLYLNYLQPLAVGTSADDLEVAGRLGGALNWSDGVVHDAELRFENFYAFDNAERFSLAGLNGVLAYTDGDQALPSSISWEALSVYRLVFGASEVEFESQQSRMRSVKWSDISFVDGKIRIDKLDVGLDDTGVSLELGGELTPVSVLDLTQQLQWPLMKGTLAGRLEGLRYRAGTASIDGGLRFEMFDGEVIVHDLSLSNIFDTVPVFRTSIDVNDIDLELLTGTFSFGKIEGRLGGYIRDLTLEACSRLPSMRAWKRRKMMIPDTESPSVRSIIWGQSAVVRVARCPQAWWVFFASTLTTGSVYPAACTMASASSAAWKRTRTVFTY